MEAEASPTILRQEKTRKIFRQCPADTIHNFLAHNQMLNDYGATSFRIARNSVLIHFSKIIILLGNIFYIIFSGFFLKLIIHDGFFSLFFLCLSVCCSLNERGGAMNESEEELNVRDGFQTRSRFEKNLLQWLRRQETWNGGSTHHQEKITKRERWT